jgi:5-methylcytosine-specific restriction endonuclease McrA
MSPHSAMRFCAEPGCRNLVRRARCEQHSKRPAKQIKTTDRGLGWRWQQLREIVLLEEPLCYYCLALGFIVSASCVDHKRPRALGGTDERSNLAGSCKTCNDSKGDRTAEEFLRQRQGDVQSRGRHFP